MDIFKILQDIIDQRKQDPKPGSYTNYLLDTKGLVERKINEEAYEVIEASLNNDTASIIEESADLFYHMLVMLSKRGITIDDICDALEKRRS